MDEAAAQAFVNAGRQIEAGRLPLWSGTSDTAFTAEQWIQRIQKAATAGGWTDPVIMSNVFNALRGDALIWYDALPTIGYNSANWEDFKTAFLRTYGTVRTVRTTALNVTDIKQGASESAAQYMARVIKIIDDIKFIAPAQLPEPATPWSDAFTGAAGWAAITAAQKTTQMQRLLQAGAADAYNRVGLQLFIAGLKPVLRSKLMETDPANMRQAFEAAVNFEGLLKEPTRGSKPVHIAAVAGEEITDTNDRHVSPDEEEEDEEAEIVAITKKLKNLKKKAQNKKKKNNGSQSQVQNKQQQQRQTSAAAKDECRYCHVKGHMQRACFKRKAAGAPCVDQYGNPLPGESVHGISTQQQQFEQWQQQQQQHFNGAAFNSAPQQYAQMGAAGGVGALWANNPYNNRGGEFENVPNGFPLNY
jgi:hypothetical protein